ncbi:peptidoglycan-binding domain-containing protein [Xanthobacter sp. AM11]|uniref:peptidoglycan-binding domain-containing protein n=1 Tax=Xanthobacter sp. AM11 TaxID=3380643 RepID=UPI0039BF2C8D
MLTCRRFESSQQLQRAAENSPPLKNGTSGEGVAELQDVLFDLRYDLKRSFAKGRADGIFGSETQAAVTAFQADMGLEKDGVAGRLTLAVLDELIKADPRLDAPPPSAAEPDAGQRSGPYHLRPHAHW